METHKALEVEILWKWALFLLSSHLCAVYGLYLVLFTSTKLYTSLFGLFILVLSGVGITAGHHRLWSHKSYKAKWPLRLILMLMCTIAFEHYIIEWCIDHRIHHKYTDTNADPYNSKRGFFFSHVGWLVVRRHPDYLDKRRKIIRDDLINDPIVMLQKKYYVPLAFILCFFLPTVIPVYFWDETYINAFFISTMLRFVIILNMTWSVNSFAHIWGNRPYDESISPADNLSVSLSSFGEGWHNYHHVFPWDYKAAELGDYRFNVTTGFIDFFALIGWAYDLKTVSNAMVLKRAKRTGHGSYINGEGIWGWDDSNLSNDDRKSTRFFNKFDD